MESNITAPATTPTPIPIPAARIYDVGEDKRGPYIVMEYVEGSTLRDAELERPVRLPAAVGADSASRSLPRSGRPRWPG